VYYTSDDMMDLGKSRDWKTPTTYEIANELDKIRYVYNKKT